MSLVFLRQLYVYFTTFIMNPPSYSRMIHLRPIPYLQQQHPFVKITLVDDHTWGMGLVRQYVNGPDIRFIDALMGHDAIKTTDHHNIKND